MAFLHEVGQALPARYGGARLTEKGERPEGVWWHHAQDAITFRDVAGVVIFHITSRDVVLAPEIIVDWTATPPCCRRGVLACPDVDE